MTLPSPVGRQHEVLYLPASGHTVVLGTAGSGKTTLAVLRARYLADGNFDHAGPTLLVTFNKTLVAYLRHLARQELVGVTVETYHTFARGYVHSRRPIPRWGAICKDRRPLITVAINQLREQHIELTALLNRPTDFFEDEIHWIASHGFTTLEDYVAAERVGRAADGVPRRLRPIVFAVYEAYRSQRSVAQMLYDWDDLASAARALLAVDSSPRRYRHIVIDEGQDFSPEMLRSLVLAVPADGSVTFFGDYAQQIYGTRMSWRQAGLRIAKVEHFEENYRNSLPIANLALAVSQMDYFRGVTDLVAPKTPPALGPPPTLVRCRSTGEELQLVATVVEQAAATASVAVLCRDRDDARRVANRVSNQIRKICLWDNPGWIGDSGLYYGTYHSAKGLEFETVVLPYCSADRIPTPGDIAAFGREEALARDGRLLYVAITRARSQLLITYTGTPSQLLPQAADLYQVVEQ